MTLRLFLAVSSIQSVLSDVFSTKLLSAVALWTSESSSAFGGQTGRLSHSTLPMPHPQGHSVKPLDPWPCVNVRAVQPSVDETVALG